MPARRRIDPEREDISYDEDSRVYYDDGDGDPRGERQNGESKVQVELEKRRAGGEPLRPVVPVNSRTLSTKGFTKGGR